MRYKVGDKVRVRNDLKKNVMHGGLCVIDEMLKKKIVTITSVHDGYYKVVEDDYRWTDKMFEGLAEEELTAEEAIKIQAEMCRCIMCKDCEIDKIRDDSHYECAEFRSKNPGKVVEILKQWKKDHEKKEVKTEFVNIVRVIEDLGYTKKCVYEEDVTGVKDETFKMSMKRILEEYCMEHEGKFFIVYEEICRVKE